MARKKHLINIHTSTGTTAPTNASLYLGEIAVQHTPNDPALWIKVGSDESSTDYEKFIGETEIIELIDNSEIILGSGYTYTGLPYVNSATTIANAYSALTKEMIDNEIVVAAALNDLNGRVIELSGNTGGAETDPIFSSSVAAGITQTDIDKWNAAAGGGSTDPNAITGITMNGNAVSVSNRVAGLGTVITAETRLSKGTTTGTGNVVTDLSVNNHQITLAKSFSAAPADLFVALSGATDSKITSLSAATTAHTGNSGIHVTSTEKSTWNGKQDAIGDLSTIRSNAVSGMAAYNNVDALSAGTIDELSKKSNTGHTHTISEVSGLQTALDGKSGTGHTHSNYATTGTVNTLNNTVTAHTADTAIHVTTAQTSAWDGKQDAISDLETIRTNAASGMAAYNNVNALSAATIALSAATVTLSSSTNADIQVISANTIELSSATVALSSASEDFFDGAEYISSAKTIVFKNGNVEKASIDATEFIKDGMVSAVTISGDSMIISFNTDAGREDIALELTDIFNPDNYYTKDDINNGVSASTLELSAGTISELAKKSNTGHTHAISEVNGLQSALDGKSDTGHTHDNYATTGTVNTLNNTVTAHTADTTIHVTSTEKSAWNGKQDAISDLAEIRSNAASGMSAYNDVNALSAATTAHTGNNNIHVTAAQKTEWTNGANSGLSAYEKVQALSAATTAHTENSDIHVTSTEKSTWNGKQDAIGDLAEIRANAASGMAAYDNVNALSAGTIDELSKKSNTGHTHTISEVSGLQTALDGKSGTGHTHDNYATTEVVNALNNTVTAHTANTEIHVTTAQTAAWNNKQDAIADLETIRSNAEAGAAKVSNVQADWNTTATTDESYIKNKPTIPTVPTSNTAFTNDAGYITGETDPTVPAWAKAENKPAYTASEVGALPTGATLDDVVDGTTRKLSNYATTGTVNTLSDTVTAHTANTDIHVTATEKSTWDGKQNAIGDLAEIRTNAASGMAAYNDVNALSSATISELAKKSNTGHTHAISDITNLQTTLDGKSDTSHTHSNYATTANLNNLSGGTTAHTSNSAIHVPTGGTNGQVLMVEDGVPKWVTPATITYSSSEPTGGNDGDIWVQI